MKEENVICIYDENAPSITDKILEAFERYLKSILQTNQSL